MPIAFALVGPSARAAVCQSRCAYQPLAQVVSPFLGHQIAPTWWSLRDYLSHVYASAQCHGSKASSLDEFGETRSDSMSKHQRGNKEAKKPKQPAPAMKPLVPVDAGPTLGPVVPDRLKRK